MLKGDDLSSAYASADIFIMPSETETLGFVALEAMASGLAVVAVAAGGLVDIITKPGITGGPSDPFSGSVSALTSSWSYRTRPQAISCNVMLSGCAQRAQHAQQLKSPNLCLQTYAPAGCMFALSVSCMQRFTMLVTSRSSGLLDLPCTSLSKQLPHAASE